MLYSYYHMLVLPNVFVCVFIIVLRFLPTQQAVVLFFRETWQCIKNIKSEPHVLHNLGHTLETLPCSETLCVWRHLRKF